MRMLLRALSLSLCTIAVGRPVRADELPLIARETLAAWEFVAEKPADITTVCTPAADGVLLIAGQPTGWIATRKSYENYRLRFDYRWTDKAGNAGLLVHIASGPKDRIWPECFQLQTKTQRAGDLLPMAGATCEPRLAEGAKAIDRRAEPSEKPVGEWNVCEVVCRDDTIECTVNGVLQNRITACVPSAGRIGFQLEGIPYELRHVTLESLP